MSEKKSFATPGWVANLFQDALGEGNIDATEWESRGKIAITFGAHGRYGVRATTLEGLGEEKARYFILDTLRHITGNPDLELTKAEQDVEDVPKRKLSKKAEAVDQALDMAGSTKKEKDEVLKDA